MQIMSVSGIMPVYTICAHRAGLILWPSIIVRNMILKCCKLERCRHFDTIFLTYYYRLNLGNIPTSAESSDLKSLIKGSASSPFMFSVAKTGGESQQRHIPTV